MKLIIRLLSFVLLSSSVFSQGYEGKLPIGSLPELHKQILVQKSTVLSKTGGSKLFPFNDWFYKPVLSDSLWNPSNSNIVGGKVVFNSIDSLGSVFSGGNGQADVLKSKSISFYPTTNEAYISFTYSTGNSWSASDSLVLICKTSGGNPVTLWSSPSANAFSQEVLVPITPLANFTGSDFWFEFVLYTSFSSSNTSTFTISQVSLSEKITLPLYENFFNYDSTHLMPLGNNWMLFQTNVGSVVETGKGRSNAVIFDAYDELGKVYNNANGQFGTADKLVSGLVNLTSFNASENIFLRFFAKAMPNANTTDSLILEYRNNSGVWQSVWSMTGAQQGNFQTFLQNINFGKYRGAQFQFRFSLRCHYLSTDTLKFQLAGVHIGRKLALPFLDDFSASNIYPDQSKWQNKNTYINTRFPIKPPSINVATFDALDQFGNPYKNVVRYTDTLTTLSINLSGIPLNDTNLFMSFWVQAKGRGDLPNSFDSLLLDFKSSATEKDVFTNVWRGARADYPTDSFVRIVIKVDSIYFHDDFQIRFKNKCSKMGNLDHWHIDFVRLDNTGRQDLTWYNDVTLSEAPGSLLTPYASMPYDHFQVSPTTYMRTSQIITAANLKDAPKPIKYAREIFDPSGVRIDSIGNPVGSVITMQDITLPSVQPPFNAAATGDSTVYKVRYTATSIAGGDNNIYTNDSLTVPTIFSNYYAYDDGSAENGYAIMNTTGSFALKYNLPKADKLYGVTIFFNQSVTDVSSKTFTLKIWKRINTNGNGTGEDVLASIPLLSPVYTNKINGFYYYQFAGPLDLSAGDFYIGWKQDQIFALNIGCDENFDLNGNHINPNGYVFLDDIGIWEQTQATGAVMIRPVVGKWIDPPVGLANQLQTDRDKFSFYPNPASNVIYFTDKEQYYTQIQLLDINGNIIQTNFNVNKKFELPTLSTGIYLLKVTDKSGAISVRKLFIEPY